jgi:hypothetical protein
MFRNHDVQHIGSSRGVVRFGGWGVLTKDQTGVPVGIITQNVPPSRGQPRVPVYMLGLQVAGHQDRQPAPKTSIRFRPDGCKLKGTPRISNGLSAKILCMAVASSSVRRETRAERWTMRLQASAAPMCWSLRAVPDIIGKPEGLNWIKKFFTSKKNIDKMLVG